MPPLGDAYVMSVNGARKVGAFWLWSCMLGHVKSQKKKKPNMWGRTRYHPVFRSVLPSLSCEVTKKRTLSFADEMVEGG